MIVDLGLMAALGFLGSFGHCVGMCGPLAIAFSLSNHSEATTSAPAADPVRHISFHLLLNLGRLLSYVLVGAAIGGLGSVLLAGGEMAGVGSLLRRGVALFTGGLLIILGLRQMAPQFLSQLPLLHPLQGSLHQRLHHAMSHTAQTQQWWTPLLLGLVWGLVPCGFLYTAQIKAAEASSLTGGALTLLAFGLGTVPMMMGVGVSSAWLSRDRASQLYQMGGWITLLIGVLTLLRTGDLMVDYTGYLSLLFLGLALVARPLSKVFPHLFKFRRLLGVGAFVLAVAHTLHMLEHSWGWQLAALQFMLPQHRWAMVAGGVGLLLMMPLALTSNTIAQQKLGKRWRSLHLLSVPALLLASVHGVLAGPTFFGSFQWQGRSLINTLILGGCLLLIFAIRSPWCWRWLGISHWYAPVKGLRAAKEPVGAKSQ